MQRRKKRQFPLFHVGKELPNGTRFELMGVFYTHYRARKFLLTRLSEQPQPENFRWVIRAE